MKRIKKFNEMYGHPLEPNKCKFLLFIDDGEADMYISGDGDICLCIEDIDESDNDDIRDINHPDFDKLCNNASENVFLSNGFEDFKSLEEARKWCLSIGMIESEDINEALLRQNSLDQLKKLRKITKGYDIGDRLDPMQGNNLVWQKNFIDNNVETFEEYHKKNQNFRINQNVINFVPKK